MKKLLANDNVLMLGVGVVAFIGVRYLMKMQEEKKSNALGAFTSKTRCEGLTGGSYTHCCQEAPNDPNCAKGLAGGYQTGGFTSMQSLGGW